MRHECETREYHTTIGASSHKLSVKTSDYINFRPLSSTLQKTSRNWAEGMKRKRIFMTHGCDISYILSPCRCI